MIVTTAANGGLSVPLPWISVPAVAGFVGRTCLEGLADAGIDEEADLGEF